MPDLFDNFFGKISTTLNGGKSTPRYGGSTQVNSGKFYSYHMNATNNKSWMPIQDFGQTMDDEPAKPRMGSMSSMSSDDPKSRNSSVSE